MHPADEIWGTKSNKLSKKRIVLAVTGSIAAVETVKLSRELIRHGAEVYPVMSSSALKIIHQDALWFATGNKPIIELTGQTEHVYYCGKIKDPVDLLLIAPCTANTISKIAHGIDDTPVTTFATTAIGSGISVIIVPAMHISMYDNKIIQKNIEICKKLGINFIGPKKEKNKAKIPEVDEIVAYVLREIGKKDLKKNKILVIGGPTEEPIDDVRVISNKSSGKTAVSLAKNAFFRGADIALLYGKGIVKVPTYINYKQFKSVDDLHALLKKSDLKKYDIIILCAAISDYIPLKKKGKIPSGKEKLIVEMHPAPKIISNLRKMAPKSKIIGFKLEEDKNQLKAKAYKLLKKNNLDYVVANTISGLENIENEIWIINKKGKINHKKGDKNQLSEFILDSIK
jgi:phosphopantothenoylcysteine decarboxylase / phosphopantothenate---cysteine ligase